MDARLLDVLHHRGDVGVTPSQSASTSSSIAFSRKRSTSVGPSTPWKASTTWFVVADPHRAAAEHVRRAHEHRVADAVRDRGRLRAGARDPPVRAADAEVGEQLPEALAVLGEVDRVERRAEDREAGRLDRARELERRLAAELDARRRPAARARARRAPPPRRAARSRGGRRCRSRSRRSPGCS